MKQVLALALILIASALAAPANAGSGTLYKAVDSNGTILFSDTPPSGDVTIVEQRSLPSIGAPTRTAAASPELQSVDGDAALARANEQVDLAEHALALARRNLWSAGEGLRLHQAHKTLADTQRVEFYKKNLRKARAHLTELVRERHSQEVRLAGNSAADTGALPSAPVLVATNYPMR